VKRSILTTVLLLATGIGLASRDARAEQEGGVPPPQRAYSISRDDAVLRVIDLSNGNTVGSVAMALSSATIVGGNGLATDPLSGTLYGLVKLQGQAGRELVTIDPGTGACMSIGDTGDRFAGIAFDSTGILFGVTGDGADTPETLYTLSTVDASPTLFLELGDGDDGEALAFNPDDSLLYHASGFLTQVFQTIDTDTLGVSDILLTGDDYGEARGLTYEGSNTFLVTNVEGPSLYRVTTTGVVTLAAPLDHASKGLAPITPESCGSDPECDDGLFCTGVESCVDGFCQFGSDPCPGQFCNEDTDSCGCLTDTDCDDADSCTTDTCDTGACLNDPVPDTDADGWCDTIDNCPQFPNASQEPALFGQTLLGLNKDVFAWSLSADVFIARGAFILGSDVGDYTVNASVPGSSDRFSDSTTPASGSGLWYLVRPDCSNPSWSSGGPGEVPGVRDTSLP
jgi:hypothetical protein